MTNPLVLLARSWHLYRTHAATYLGYAAWLLLPLCALLILTTFPNHVLVSALAIVVTIWEVFLALWIAVCLMRLTVAVSQDKTPDHAQLSRESAMRIPAVLVTGFIQALIVLGGLLLLVIPGILFWVWYSFAQVAAAVEGSRPIESLTASRLLVRGRFFPVLLRLLVGPLIVGFLYALILSGVVSLIAVSVGMDPIALVTQEPPIWLAGLESLGEVFLLPVLVIYMVLLYLDLKTHPAQAVDKSCEVA